MTTGHQGTAPGPEVGAFTLTGFHPRDGEPIPCWIIHPSAAGPLEPMLMEELKRTLRLTPTHRESHFADRADGPRTWTIGRHAVLRASNGSELHARHDERWLNALEVRGWAVVVLVNSDHVIAAPHRELHAYFESGGHAHVGLARIP